MNFFLLISSIALLTLPFPAQPLALPAKSSLPKPPLPFPSSFTVAEKAKSYLNYRRELIDKGLLTPPASGEKRQGSEATEATEAQPHP